MHDNRHRIKPNWLHRLGVKGKQGELCVDFPKHTREFKIPQRRRRQRRLFKSEFASFKSLSRLFQERTLSNAIELSGYELRRTISMFRKERKFRGYLFTSSIKRETIGFCTSKSCSDGKKKKNAKRNVLHVSRVAVLPIQATNFYAVPISVAFEALQRRVWTKRREVKMFLPSVRTAVFSRS